MRIGKRQWIKCLVLVLVLLLIVPVFMACGGGEKDEEVPIDTSASILTDTPTVTPSTTTSNGPVKIGVITAWSGPMALSGQIADQQMALVEEQLKNAGGILGGREVKFVRGDDRGMVADSAGQARKLILEDKVTVLATGSLSAAHFSAAGQVAEEFKVPCIAISTIYGLESMKYCADLFDSNILTGRVVNFTLDVVKPKTVAYLAYDSQSSREVWGGRTGPIGVGGIGAGASLKSKGVDTIYEQYFPQDTADYSPYITKIKYLKPDLLITFVNNAGQAITLFKQMTELGGLGSIKYFSATEVGLTKAAITLPIAVGTYSAALWMPGSTDPGMKTFEDAYTQKYNRQPNPDLTYYYNLLWTAVKAIELADTVDQEKIAQALRSGNLEWDSAWGPLRIGTDGQGVCDVSVVQIQEGGKLIKVWPQ